MFEWRTSPGSHACRRLKQGAPPLDPEFPGQAREVIRWRLYDDHPVRDVPEQVLRTARTAATGEPIAINVDQGGRYRHQHGAGRISWPALFLEGRDDDLV